MRSSWSTIRSKRRRVSCRSRSRISRCRGAGPIRRSSAASIGWCRPTRLPEMDAGHALLDMGGGARLERFGARVTDRPHPGALGARGDPSAWRAADLRYDRDQGWSGDADVAEPWPIEIDGLELELRATETGQVGLFPEHRAMLPWVRERVASRVAVGSTGGEDPSVLHPFTYQGIVSL